MICPVYADFRNIFMAGEPLAADGFPTWDATRFEGTLVLYPNWQITFPIDCQFTSSNDAVVGVDEYHWYLLQPTETTEPRLSLTLRPTASGVTASGRCILGLTAAGTALLASGDIGPAHSAEAMSNFLRGCYVYGYVIATNKYYVLDMWRAAFVPAQLDL
jgi:hypothetical protein